MSEPGARVLAREVAHLVERTPASRACHARAIAVLPGGETRASTYYAPYPATIATGHGIQLTDLDGNRYLDFLLNYTTMILGHSSPPVVEAATTALRSGSAIGAPGLGQVELADALVQRVPSVERVRFMNSGTEAALLAIRIARAVTGRSWIIKAIGGYHGSSPELDTGVRDGTWPVGVPATSPVRAVPFNDAEALQRAARELSGVLAAIILEPVMGSAGIIAPQEGYLAAARRSADGAGALLIFDEVITFRLSPGGYQQVAEIAPDLTCLGKIIGGGFPVGAVGGRAGIMEVCAASATPTIGHAGTFNGNPVTMAAGCATLAALDDGAYRTLDTLGARLAEGLRVAIDDTGARACVTHVGSLVQVHFADPPITDADRASDRNVHAARAFHLGLLNRGVFIAPRGLFAVATVTDNDAVDRAVATSRAVLADLAADGVAA